MKKAATLLVVITVLLASAAPVLADYPDPGTGKTNIFMQNIGSADAAVNLVFTTGETGGQAWQTDTGSTIPPKAARYVLNDQFGGSIGDGWAGAVEVSATEPLAAIVNMFWDKGDLKTAATYIGVDSPSTGVYLPLLAVRDGMQVSRITVQNTEDGIANITMQFYNRDGGAAGTKTATIPGKSEKTFYLHQPAWMPDFSATSGLGSAYITSNKKIAAVSSTHWWDASEAYTGVSSGDTTLWVPSVFRKFFGDNKWNYNATIIQNLGDQPANVHVEYIHMNNQVTYQFDDVIQPKASAGYNTFFKGTQDGTIFNEMVNALGSGWQGSMKITCTNGQQLAGVSFFYAYATVGDTISYNAIRASDATSKALSFPAVYRKLTGGSDAMWSTTLVQNVSNNPGTLEIRFFRAANGEEMPGGPWIVPIPANGSVRLNLKDGLELPGSALSAVTNYFSGGMYIVPSAGVQIIGVTNIIWSGQGRASGYDGFAVP